MLHILFGSILERIGIKKQKQVRVLFNNSSKINVMSPWYAKKLGLKI